MYPKAWLLNLFEIGGGSAFEFDDGKGRPVRSKDGAVGFFSVADVFELGREVEVRGRVEGIAEHIGEKIAEKPFLVLFFFSVADVFLPGGVMEFLTKNLVSLFDGSAVEIGEVFF